MNIFKFLKKIFTKSRLDNVIDKCGCACYCPKCKDILNDQADCTDTDIVRYTCNTCGHKSNWNFDIAPVPVLLDKKGVHL